MKKESIEIGENKYIVQVAVTAEDRAKGLMDVDNLPDDEGMLFVFDKPQTVGFWMKDTKIPLDIIFIDKNNEVISTFEGEPETDYLIEEDNVNLVLEVNAGSGIMDGDKLERGIEEEGSKDSKMKVLTPSGEVQMELEGGERIFSRKNTKTLIRMAKRADRDKTDAKYKALGKKAFEYIEKQDTNQPQYVEG